MPSVPQEDPMAQMSGFSKLLGSDAGSKGITGLSGIGGAGGFGDQMSDMMQDVPAGDWAGFSARGGAIPFRGYDAGGGPNVDDIPSWPLPPTIASDPPPTDGPGVNEPPPPQPAYAVPFRQEDTITGNPQPTFATTPTAGSNTLLPPTAPLSNQPTGPEQAFAGVAEPPIPRARPPEEEINAERWNTSDQPQIDPRVERLRAGIRHAETGGERNPYGSVTSTGTGHKVYGAYQIMDTNIGPWTEEAFGQRLTPQQFLNNPGAQDAVARFKLGDYAGKYGYHGAARAWLAGEGGMNNAVARDRFGSTPYGYADKVMAYANQAGDMGDDAQGGINQALAHSGEKPTAGLRAAQPAAQPEEGNFLSRLFSNRKPGAPGSAEDPRMMQPGNGIAIPLIAAGLGMMASRSPYFGVGVGQGGLMGLQAFEEQRKQALSEKQIQERANMLEEQIKHMHKQEDVATEHLGIERERLNRPIKMTDPVSGVEYLADPRSGKPVGNTQGAVGPNARPLADPNSPGVQPGTPENKTHAAGTHPEVLTEIAKVDPNLPATVKAISEGRMTLQSAGYKDKTRLAKFVNAYDPNWNQQVFAARQRQLNDETSNGTAGKMIMATNQLLPHLNTLSRRAEALDNSNYPGVNTIKNWILTKTGDPRIKEFTSTREVAALDTARLLRGSGQMSEKDIEEWRKQISEADSPRTLQGVIQNLSEDLIGARINSIQQTHRSVMGTEPPDWISGEAKTARNAIKERAALTEARNEIDRGGTSKESVIANLRSQGIDPAKLGPNYQSSAASQGTQQNKSSATSETPPAPGARKANDGHWYTPDPNRPGKYLRVD